MECVFCNQTYEQAIARLEQATEIVRKGWLSGDWGMANGKVCATGGLMVAQQPTVFNSYYFAGLGSTTVGRDGQAHRVEGLVKTYDFRADDVTLAAMTALASAIKGGLVNSDLADLIGVIAPWNDARGRTQDEVIAMYVAATAILRASLQTATPIALANKTEPTKEFA